ncbi:hypothetical protein OHS81_16590 [Streptomyces sp. NBC_00400]|uniref:hypothetical protein n=1 Tax=Streptomyces sp. NBC_00400 TaxID=2975737 RepID=UPI002E1F663F
MNSEPREPDSSYAAARPAPRSPLARRRPAVVLALLVGLLAAAVAPATAAGRDAVDGTRAAATASAPGRNADASGLAAAPARSAVYRHHSAHHSAPLKTVFKAKKSKTSKSKAKKKGGFFKKLGIFLIVLFVLFLVVVILVIWLIVRFFRRAARNRRND